MSGPTRRGLPSRKNFVTSFLLSLILIGSVISSASLLGFTISPQQAWAAPPATAPQQLTDPPNGHTISDTTPFFDWSSVSATPSVTSYRIVVDNNANFGSPELNTTTSSSSQFTAITPLALDTYSWKVRAINNDGVGPFSLPSTFTISDLNGPLLNTPADGAKIQDRTPNFDWSSISNEPAGGYYLVQADNDGSSFSSPEVDNNQLMTASSQFTPPSNLTDGTYSWRVGSKSNLADTTPSWSVTRTLIIDDTNPTAPSLISPTSGAFTTASPIFDWSDVTDLSGIDRYVLQHSTTSNFASGTVTSINVDGPSGNPPAPSTFSASGLSAGNKFWRVSARDDAGNTGPFSAGQPFTVDNTAPTQIPVLVAPTNGATINDNTPLFDWNDVTNPGAPASPLLYELRVATTNPPTSGNTISELSLSSSTFTPGSALPDGTYFWNVRAKDTAGNLGPLLVPLILLAFQ